MPIVPIPIVPMGAQFMPNSYPCVHVSARNVPPRMRTHAETVATGEYLSYFGTGEKLTKKEYDEIKHDTGVTGFCVFCLVDLFDIIEDFTLDWMHIMKGIWPGNLVPMFIDGYKPAEPKRTFVPPSTAADPGLSDRVRATNRRRMARYKQMEGVQHIPVPNVCPLVLYIMPNVLTKIPIH